MISLFPPLTNETRRALDRLPRLIDEVFPLPARFRPGLKHDVAELSRLLTSARNERDVSYLGKPALLSAYLRYFLPWNIYRLCRLFGSLPLNLKPGDSVNDLGAGPLTFEAALWISRPELRDIPLEFRCLDRTAAVLEAGRKFFVALAAALPGKDARGECPWTTRTVKGEIKRNGKLSVEIRGKPAALSAAINVYNELFWDIPHGNRDELDRFTENQAELISSLSDDSGAVLVVEPGIPRSGEYISLLRSALAGRGRRPLSPCTHQGPCPLPGRKTGSGGQVKWCHFAFDTDDAPEELRRLSRAALIPKERAVLSFIFAGPVSDEKKSGAPETGKETPKVSVRIISDSFPVSGGKNLRRDSRGRYGCSRRGLVLVTGSGDALEDSPPGALLELNLAGDILDEKSGALVAVKSR